MLGANGANIALLRAPLSLEEEKRFRVAHSVLR